MPSKSTNEDQRRRSKLGKELELETPEDLTIEPSPLSDDQSSHLKLSTKSSQRTSTSITQQARSSTPAGSTASPFDKGPSNIFKKLYVRERMVLCRICEELYRISEMEDHSKICAIQREFHAKNSALNSKLKKYASILNAKRMLSRPKDFENTFDCEASKEICEYFESKVLKAIPLKSDLPENMLMCSTDLKRYVFKLRNYAEAEKELLKKDTHLLSVITRILNVVSFV